MPQHISESRKGKRQKTRPSVHPREEYKGTTKRTPRRERPIEEDDFFLSERPTKPRKRTENHSRSQNKSQRQALNHSLSRKRPRDARTKPVAAKAEVEEEETKPKEEAVRHKRTRRGRKKKHTNQVSNNGKDSKQKTEASSNSNSSDVGFFSHNILANAEDRDFMNLLNTPDVLLDDAETDVWWWRKGGLLVEESKRVEVSLHELPQPV